MRVRSPPRAPSVTPQAASPRPLPVARNRPHLVPITTRTGDSLTREAASALLSSLSAKGGGVFRGAVAVAHGVHRNQLTALVAAGVVVRVFPDTYRMAAVPETDDLRLRAALCWAGEGAAAAGRSAGWVYRLEGVTASTPEVVVTRSRGARHSDIVVRHVDEPAALMMRRYNGSPVTGIEATLLALAHELDGEA